MQKGLFCVPTYFRNLTSHNNYNLQNFSLTSTSVKDIELPLSKCGDGKSVFLGGRVMLISSGKLFQTAGAACEKARSAKARLVQSSCSRFLRRIEVGVKQHET